MNRITFIATASSSVEVTVSSGEDIPQPCTARESIIFIGEEISNKQKRAEALFHTYDKSCKINLPRKTNRRNV